jgi:hypothetical protein
MAQSGQYLKHQKFISARKWWTAPNVMDTCLLNALRQYGSRRSLYWNYPQPQIAVPYAAQECWRLRHNRRRCSRPEKVEAGLSAQSPKQSGERMLLKHAPEMVTAKHAGKLTHCVRNERVCLTLHPLSARFFGTCVCRLSYSGSVSLQTAGGSHGPDAPHQSQPPGCLQSRARPLMDHPKIRFLRRRKLPEISPETVQKLQRFRALAWLIDKN